MPVVYAEAETLAACLRVRELVNRHHGLSQVATHLTHQLKEVVFAEVLSHPERHVLVAGRELGVGLELGNLPGLKLFQEPRVCRPELPDVVNFK